MGKAIQTYSLIQAAESHPISPGLRFAEQVPLILPPDVADPMEHDQSKSYRKPTYGSSGEKMWTASKAFASLTP